MASKSQKETTRQIIRILKVLSKNQRTGVLYSTKGETINIEFNQRQYAFKQELIANLKKQDYILVLSTHLKVTEAGMLYLKHQLNPDFEIANSHRNLKTVTTTILNEQTSAVQNTNESPLLRLFTRKTKAGDTYISVEEFQAGERLRKDFERGQLQPKISASLQGSMGNAKNAQASSSSDIADFAMDARKRVGLAVDKLGPELSGVTLDICCFLKGLEIVERERRWPPRSAKLMLKTALSLLAKHYGISGYKNTRTKGSSFWGSADYRPVLNR